MESIEFVEIANFNDWPNKLISNQNLVIKEKTNKEILREFDREKWTYINNLIDKTNYPTIQNIEKKIDFNEKIVSVYKGKFYKILKKEIDELHIKLYTDTILKYLDKVEYIVELGAGFGSKILRIASDERFKNKKIIAGELTDQGQKAIKKIASSMGIEIKVGFCDIGKGDFRDLNIPYNSLIFTSYSTHYTSKIKKGVYKKLMSLKPNVIIHFEPIYEVFSKNNIYDLMCKKYIEINDYNTNLLTVIENLNKEGLLKFTIDQNVIGINPFLPISVIECSTEI